MSAVLAWVIPRPRRRSAQTAFPDAGRAAATRPTTPPRDRAGPRAGGAGADRASRGARARVTVPRSAPVVHTMTDARPGLPSRLAVRAAARAMPGGLPSGADRWFTSGRVATTQPYTRSRTATSSVRVAVGREPARRSTIDPMVDMTTPIKEQVDRMAAATYFNYAAGLMGLHRRTSPTGPWWLG